jgi:hypothetical protein
LFHQFQSLKGCIPQNAKVEHLETTIGMGVPKKRLQLLRIRPLLVDVWTECPGIPETDDPEGGPRLRRKFGVPESPGVQGEFPDRTFRQERGDGGDELSEEIRAIPLPWNGTVHIDISSVKTGSVPPDQGIVRLQDADIIDPRRNGTIVMSDYVGERMDIHGMIPDRIGESQNHLEDGEDDQKGPDRPDQFLERSSK